MTQVHLYPHSPMRQSLLYYQRRALATPSSCSPNLNTRVERFSISLRTVQFPSPPFDCSLTPPDRITPTGPIALSSSYEIETQLALVDRPSEEGVDALIWDLLEEDDGL